MSMPDRPQAPIRPQSTMSGFRSLDHHDPLPPVFAVRPDPWQWWRGIVLGYDEVDPCRGYRCVTVIEPGIGHV